METKTNPIQACELKFDDDAWRVEGYASVFDSVDSYGDTIKPGAFLKSLEKNMPRMRYEHLRWATVGKWDVAEEDEKGLKVGGQLTRDLSLSKDLRAQMRHGTVRGFSIGFNIPPGGYEEKEDGGRIIKSINLHEVSFTADPAEPKAAIEVWKSRVDELNTLSDFEHLLRESGDVTKSMATMLVSRVRDLIRSESEQKAQDLMKQHQASRQLRAILDRYDIRKLIP